MFMIKTNIGKKKILIKLKNLIYWFNQSENVARYIVECVECVRYDFVFKSQSLHFIKIFHPFQFLKINYIESLIKIFNDNVYIFHIIDYLIRFFLFMSVFSSFWKILSVVCWFYLFFTIFQKLSTLIAKFNSMQKKSESF